MRRKQGLSLLLAAALLFSLCGCNGTVEEAGGKEVELIEPVNAVSDTEAAAYRNLYDVTVYSATVYPVVREYSFAGETQIEGFGAFLGEKVLKGQALVYGSTETIDGQIEAMEERIAAMEEEIARAEETLQENLAEPKEKVKWLAGVVEAYEKVKPAEKVYASTLEEGEEDNTVSSGDSSSAGNHKENSEESSSTGESGDNGSDGDDRNGQETEDKLVINPAYLAWEKEADVFIGQYRILAHSIHVQEENFRQKKELYELEHAYYQEQLEAWKEQRREYILTAREAGEVMAVPEAGYGAYQAGAEEMVIAVGNTQEKLLKCDFINKADVAAAKDLYALIDGVRYEIEYQPMDSDAYAKLAAAGEKIYSTFVLKGDTSQVCVGDFAVIALFREKKEQVLSIPKEALHKDEAGYYTYVMEEDEAAVVPVKVGISDGVYTEITSGLTEGTRVLVEKAAEYSEERVTVKKGSFQSSFENRGMMYYPVTEGVYNTVEYGTAYFGEYLVAEYAYVEKGDVIATVRVAMDEISLQRNQTRLQRARERLADLRKDGEEENKKAIEAKLEEIAELEELIAAMEADGATKEIRAGRSGILVGLGDYEKETILNYNSHIAEIADKSACYVVVENENNLLNYGNQVTITYTNQENQEKEAKGMVANLSQAGVSGDLQTAYSYILLPEEAIEDMSVSNNTGEEWWNYYRYTVSAAIREMDNVLVVPRKAVTQKNGCTYVNVVDEQGNVKACSFVAGGYDASNYWVVEGLSEGMVICLK